MVHDSGHLGGSCRSLVCIGAVTSMLVERVPLGAFRRPSACTVVFGIFPSVAPIRDETEIPRCLCVK